MNVSIKNNSDINDLARWIDDHLEMELSVDIVAKKLDIQNGICKGCINMSLVSLLAGISEIAD